MRPATVSALNHSTTGQMVRETGFCLRDQSLLAFVPTVRVNRRLAQAFLAWSLLDHEAAETMFEDIWRLPRGTP